MQNMCFLHNYKILKFCKLGLFNLAIMRYNSQQFSDLAMLVPESKYGSWGNWILSFPIIGTGYWRKHDRHYYIGQ